MVTITHRIELSPRLETLLRETRQSLWAAITDLKGKLMADSASILAKVTANTDVLKSVALTADALNEGQSTIEALIAELKAQIASGQTPTDFASLDAALDEQTAVIEGMSAAIAAPKPPAEVPVE